MRVRTRYTCPLEIVHDLIKGKWKTLLIFQLRHGSQSFSALLRGLAMPNGRQRNDRIRQTPAY